MAGRWAARSGIAGLGTDERSKFQPPGERLMWRRGEGFNMDSLIRNRSGNRRCLAGCFLIIACSTLPVFAVAHASGRDAAASLDEPGAAARPPDTCFAETSAYLRVVGLAREFGKNGSVFADAIGDLRSQLADCLDDTGGPAIFTIQERQRTSAPLR
jgi:hypothetical protein